MRYLICDKCGGFYELQPGESPEDFDLTCNCGGELKCYHSIDDEYIKNNSNSSPNHTKKIQSPIKGLDQDHFKWRWLWGKF